MQPQLTARILAALACLCLAAPVGAAPEDYTFENVADTDDGFYSFEEPAINNFGEVVFYGTIEDGSGGYIRGFYTGSDHAGSDKIVDDTGPLGSFDSDPVIFDDGRVAFIGDLPNGNEAVFVGPDPTLPILDESGPYYSFEQVSAGADGSIYVRAETDSGIIGIFDGPTPRQDFVVAGTGVVYTSISRYAHAAEGVYVFPASLPSGVAGLYTGPDPLTDTVADDAGPIDLFTQYDISIDGQVVFAANLDDGRSALLTGPDVVDDLIVDDTGPFGGFNTVARSTRDIVWFGSLERGGQGVWTGTDPVADRVIQKDDILFGSPVDHVDLTTRNTWLNELGQIVFEYELEDGREGIALATPDRDQDGTADRIDTCMDAPNGPLLPDAGGNIQLDSDGDGIGNLCDGDLNQDGLVAGPDFDLFLQCFNLAVAPGVGPAEDPDCAASDMNGDGLVAGPDFDLFLTGFNAPPGPAGELVP